MLVRSVKLYDPDNSIFDKPLNGLRETINQFIAVDGKLDLQCTKDAFYVNAMLVRMDANSLDNVRYLQKEMKDKNVGGFQLIRVRLPAGPENIPVHIRHGPEGGGRGGGPQGQEVTSA
jgi:hypothetical protein